MSSKRTPKQQDRFDFFVNLGGWGDVRNARLGIICIEDGGQEWLRRKDPKTKEIIEKSDEEVAEEIEGCRHSHCSDEVEGFRFVRRDANEVDKQWARTERTQLELACNLRQMANPGEVWPPDKYGQYFMRGYEVIGNVYPFAKPRKADHLSRRMREYVGFAENIGLEEVRAEVSPARMKGLVALSKHLSKHQDGLLVFMGLWNEKETIISNLLGSNSPPGAGSSEVRIDKYVRPRKIYCWRRRGDSCTIAFVDNATYGFTSKVFPALSAYLNEVGWSK